MCVVDSKVFAVGTLLGQRHFCSHTQLSRSSRQTGFVKFEGRRRRTKSIKRKGGLGCSYYWAKRKTWEEGEGFGFNLSSHHFLPFLVTKKRRNFSFWDVSDKIPTDRFKVKSETQTRTKKPSVSNEHMLSPYLHQLCRLKLQRQTNKTSKPILLITSLFVFIVIKVSLGRSKWKLDLKFIQTNEWNCCHQVH